MWQTTDKMDHDTEKWVTTQQKSCLRNGVIGVDSGKCFIVWRHGQQTSPVGDVAQIDVTHRTGTQCKPRHRKRAESIAARARLQRCSGSQWVWDSRYGTARRVWVRDDVISRSRRQAQTKNRQQSLHGQKNSDTRSDAFDLMRQSLTTE